VTRGRARSAVACLAIAGLAVPGAADAKRIVFGSDLAAPANLAEAHGADSVFWNKRLANGRGPRVPAHGQILKIRIKGKARKLGRRKPLTLFHVQVLHPIGHHRVRVKLSAGDYHLPYRGSVNQINEWRPVNLCAHRHDRVAFNDAGGFNPKHYPSGTPFQVFSSTFGSTTNFFTKDNGTNNGARFRGKPHRHEELLMQLVLGTGKDANRYCRHH
jgi:murein DD-endopeptidase MepM/ murein hydrolase activator NlpD